MGKPVEFSPRDIMQIEQAFFGPCAVCGKSEETRAALIQLGSCPKACDHMRRVEERLRQVRRDFSASQQHQPGA